VLVRTFHCEPSKETRRSPPGPDFNGPESTIGASAQLAVAGGRIRGCFPGRAIEVIGERLLRRISFTEVAIQILRAAHEGADERAGERQRQRLPALPIAVAERILGPYPKIFRTG